MNGRKLSVLVSACNRHRRLNCYCSSALALRRHRLGFRVNCLHSFQVSLLVWCPVCCYRCSWQLSRFLRQWLLRRHSGLVGGLDTLTKHDAFWKVVMLRFQPLGTNLLTNLAAGVSGIPARLFGSSSQLAVSFALLLISVILGLWLLARSSARRAS